jgi:hypothetical protein
MGRAVIVVFGGLLVLQSSQDLAPLKVAYLAVAIVAVAMSVLNVVRLRQSPVVVAARPWLIASAVLAGMIALSLPIAVVRGTPIAAWLRDAAAYGLLAAAPWLAVDLAFATSRRTVLGLAVAAGAIAAVSFAIVWTQRRQMSDFPIDRLALPSMILAASLFALGLAIAISEQRHRYRWAAASALAIGLLMYSGTRSSLVLLVVAPIALLASWLSDRRSPLRPRLLAALVPVVVALGIVGATQIQLAAGTSPFGGDPGTGNGSGASPSRGPGPPNLSERYESIGSVLSGQDVSLQERLFQTRAVWNVFISSPIVGGGLGVAIPWTDPRGVTHTDNAFTADTPILVLAKFGLLGLVLIAVAGWATIATLRMLAAGGRATRRSWLSIVAFGMVILVLMPFGWQLEDKGTALAIVLVLGFCLVEARDARLAAGASGDGTAGPVPSQPPPGGLPQIDGRP